MINILIIGDDKETLPCLVEALQKKDDISIFFSKSGTEAINLLPDSKFDLVIIDEQLEDISGLEFAQKVVKVNPVLNCAAVSSLLPKAFHEASEGLGLLMQLPAQPDKTHAEELYKQLKNILYLTAKNK